MRRRPFDRFLEGSRNFQWAEADVALHSKTGHLRRDRGGLEDPESTIEQKCLGLSGTRYDCGPGSPSVAGRRPTLSISPAEDLQVPCSPQPRGASRGAALPK